MDIRIPLNQISITQLSTLSQLINDIRNKGAFEQLTGDLRLFQYVQPSAISIEQVLDLSALGVQFIGFSVYLRMTTTTYNTDIVPPGVRGDTREVENPTPPPDTITVNQLFVEWQPNVARNKNDASEVIIAVPYAPTIEEIEIFVNDASILEVMGTDIVLNVYDNDVDWVLDELGFPVTEPPIEKDSVYWTSSWSNDGEAFDFLHAQRLVNQWFQAQTGATITDKFNTLTGDQKDEVIRWGILGDTAEGKALVEGRILNPANREFLRRWHVEKLIFARAKRFNDAWAYLVDNFKNNAIVALDRLESMLTYQLREYYIYRGGSNQSQHLIVNGSINPEFWSTFGDGDVAYSDRTLDDIKARVERILDGNRY